MVTLSEESEHRPVLSAFGLHLKQLRFDSGLTQESLAERAGLSARLISNLERGTLHQPRRSTVEALADALELSDDERSRFVLLAFNDRFQTSDIPEGRSTPTVRLPVPLTSLVGRTAEISAIASCLIDPAVRVVTLTGPGGVGKTRLAIDVASSLEADFPDGIIFVELNDTRTIHGAFAEIVHALSIRSQPGANDLELIADALQQKRLLLVLDNTEQIIDGLAEFSRLISETDHLKILVTSRLTLNIRGERLLRIEPLACPQPHDSWTLEELAGGPAVALFVDRAEAVREGFHVDEQNATEIAQIVRAIDGLPLAIELAAARMSVISPADLLELMDRRLAVLTHGASDLPPRLQTLRSAIDWSHELLTEQQREMFRNLAIFNGGFTLDAAEAVHAASIVETSLEEGSNGRSQVVENLFALVEANLVQAMPDENGETRFRLLETVHEFALERLEEAGRHEHLSRAHAEYFVRFSEPAAVGSRGPDQRRWLRKMELERDNVRKAMDWSLRNDEPVFATKIAASYGYFWQIRGSMSEGRQWLEASLEASAEVPDLVRAMAELWLGVLSYHQGESRSVDIVEQALELFEGSRDPWGRAFALRHLGNIERSYGNLAEADLHQREALEVFRTLGDVVQVCATLRNLGIGAYDQQDYPAAVDLLQEALSIGEDVDDRLNLGAINNNLALVYLALGDLGRAASLQDRALRIWADLEFADGVSSSMENAALIAAEARLLEYAARMFGAADGLKKRIGSTGREIDQEFNRKVIERLHEELGSDRYRTLEEDGRGMPHAEVMALISNLPGLLVDRTA